MISLFHHNHRASAAAKRPYSAVAPEDRLEMDAFADSFMYLSGSSSSSLDFLFDRLVDSSSSDAVHCDLIDRAIRLGTDLLEAGKRSARNRASTHNSLVWPLPSDLTINVFTMLDTQSVCYAAATCNFFRKCASDPMCYASIDLLTVVPKVDNMVVSTMIERAGKALRSIKLGLVPTSIMSHGSSHLLVNGQKYSTDVSGLSWPDKRPRHGKESCILSRSCLNSLTVNSGAPGAMLRRLHLYNIERMDNTALSTALSTCPSLLDLVIVGLRVGLKQTLESVSQHCHIIERLYFESSKTGRDDTLKMSPTCTDLVDNCPHITSLALRGFKLQDDKVLTLVKGFRKLKFIDFSTSYSFTGSFLRKLVGGAGGNLLEVMILRDCMHLKKGEVTNFLSAVLAGDFKFLRHFDISNREGLASGDDWYSRCYNTSFIPMDHLYEARPNFFLLAEFPSAMEVESDGDSSLPSQQCSHTSDGSSFIYTSQSIFNSEHGSVNEDSRDTNSVIYEISSEELDSSTL